MPSEQGNFLRKLQLKRYLFNIYDAVYLIFFNEILKIVGIFLIHSLVGIKRVILRRIQKMYKVDLQLT